MDIEKGVEAVGRLSVKAKNYYVYVLSCEDGSFYTGYTISLQKRLQLHKKGLGARYTQVHRAVKVVHCERFPTRSEAMRRERQIKRLNHYQKARLFQASRDGSDIGNG